MNAEALLDRFFGDGNDVDLVQLPGRVRDDVMASCARLRDGLSTPAFLPRRCGEDAWWYGLARDERGRRELLELLAASLGPTFSDITAGHGELDADDPFDEGVMRLAEGRVVRCVVLPEPGPRREVALDVVQRTLARLGDLLARRPPSVLDIVPSVARLLADLEHSIASRDEDLGCRLLDQLERFHALTEANLLFQRIRLLAAFERYDAVLTHADLGHLVDMRRPRGVSLALIEAVFQVHLDDAFASGTVTDVFARFDAIRAEYGPLWVGAPDPNSVGTAILLALASVAPDGGQDERRERVREWLRVHSTDGLRRLDELVARAETAAVPEKPPIQHGVGRASALFLRGDPVGAIDALSDVATSVEAARLAVLSADQIGGLAAAIFALRLIDGLDDARRTEVLSSALYVAAVDRLRAIAPDDQLTPDGWIAWTLRLSAEPNWSTATDVARLGVEEWTPTSPTALLAALRDLRGDDAERAVRGAAGSMLRAHPIRGAEPASVALGTHLLLVLSVAETLSEAERGTFSMLVETILESSPSPVVFGEVLDAIHQTGTVNARAHTADWLIEMLQVLAHAPCPASRRTDRLSLFSYMTNVMQRFVTALDEMQRAALVDTAEVLGITLPGAFMRSSGEMEDDESAYAWLRDRSVCIYSLMVGASRRAAAVLRRLVPSISIALNDDHVATHDLNHLAQTADVFVVVTNSAKHAATLAIKAARKPGGVTIDCNSRGSSGILRAVRSTG
jgi:hypothetical protein